MKQSFFEFDSWKVFEIESTKQAIYSNYFSLQDIIGLTVNC